MREAAMRALLAAGWHVGKRAGALRRPITWNAVGALVARGGWAPMQHWSASTEAMTGRPPTSAAVRAALTSYIRYWIEMLTLPSMTSAQVDRAVHMSATDLASLQESVWTRGCVLALGHQANWDLAGAFAMQHHMPVSTVAENLPDGDFDRFTHYRTSLGFEIFGHQDPRAVRGLIASAKRHRLVCLLADRNLSSSGIDVDWHCAGGPRRVKVPAGPAYIAERSGADLRVLTMRYAGDQLHLRVTPPLAAGSIAERTQAVTDVLSRDIATNPRDWHVLPRFFPQDAACA